jgi:TolB-like protein
MKIRIVLILALLMAVRAVTAGELPAPGKRIAVLEFTAVKVDDSYAKALRNKIEIGLYEKKLNVIERKHMSRILFEMGNAHTCLDNLCAITQGKIVAAEYVVVGDVTCAGDYIITVRIVDVANGRILFANSASVKSKDDILAESQKVADGLSAMLGKKVKKEAEAEEAAKKKEAEKASGDAGLRLKAATAVSGDISLSGGYLLPLAFLRTKAAYGFAISASGGVVVRNCFIGLKTGYYRVYGRDRGPYSSIIPIMARFDYRFYISKFFISPGLSAGISYNMIHENGARVFELMVNPVIQAGYRFTPAFSLFACVDYYCIVEKKRGIQFMTFGAGTGFSF